MSVAELEMRLGDVDSGSDTRWEFEREMERERRKQAEDDEYLARHGEEPRVEARW
jgi:hypothetical protein